MNSSSAVSMFFFYTYNIRCLRLPILGSQIAAVAQLCKLYYIIYMLFMHARNRFQRDLIDEQTADHFMIIYYYILLFYVIYLRLL